MKTLIYFEGADAISNSGIGRAMSHQMRACQLSGVDFTINAKDTDYTIAHINTLWWKSGRLLKQCKKKGIPVIVHGHSTYEDFRRSFACWRLIEPIFDHRIRWMYSRADLIITPTPYSRDLIKGYGLCQNVIDISNGIDLEEYRPNKEDQEKFLSEFHLTREDKFVMGVGFLFERKGLQSFIEVARKFPDVKFIWFGALHPLITNAKVKKWIRHKPDNVIMAGYRKGAVIHGAYQLAQAMFFPSLEETEGIVVLEALASRTPLVVRDIGVYRDWLTDGVNCHKGSTDEEFASILSSLLQNGEDPKILEAGFQEVSKKTLDKVGLELKAAYESLSKN